MKMTKYHREALRRARELIDSERKEYICFALDVVRVHSKSDALQTACRELKVEIAAYLGPTLSLGWWQARNLPSRKRPRDTRVDRLAWIDWMLAQDEL